MRNILFEQISEKEVLIMFSRSLLADILRFEMAMGPSDGCNDCGATFLARSDGCPSCGGYRTFKLNPLETEREVWDMESFPVIIIDFDNPESCACRVNIGDFSPYLNT
jgi:hypothetical protein